MLWFAAPRTETGEDMVEFHLHGGTAIVKALLAVLGRQPACRLAEPGEFARRAFLNGKLDLAQVEGLADLVDAETEAQRRQALGQMRGALSELYEGWRGDLIRASALVEAAIDFSDEGDVAGNAVEVARNIVAELQAAIGAHLDDGNRGEILRDGFRIVLAGPPNAGKSSLLNALARRDAAIVSEEAGTTRDVIEVRLDLGGLPVIVSDTAGIRDAARGHRAGRHPPHAGARARCRSGAVARRCIAAGRRSAARRSGARGQVFLARGDENRSPRCRSARGDMRPSPPRRGPAWPSLSARLAEMARDRIGDMSAPAITRERYRHQLATVHERT